MDAGILKAALSQQAHVPTSVTSDQYFNPRAPENNPHAHSSQLLAENRSDWTSETTVRRLYTWADVINDETHRDSLKKLYGMHHQATDKCLFPWIVRSALGDYFCPPKSTNEDLFRIGRDSPADQKAISKHIIDMVLTAVVDGEAADAETLQSWADDILRDENVDDLLSQMYIEMETKASRERTIWARIQKARSRQAPKSSITLYSNSAPTTPAPAPAHPHGQDPVPPVSQPQKPQVRREEPPEKEPHEEYVTLDDDVLRERRTYSRYLSLKEHVEETGRDRVYNTLSMRMFSFALIASFWIGLIPNIWCVDGYAIIFTFFYCHLLGLAGLSLASLVPRYWGLDVFYVVGWLAVVIMFIYTFLRIVVYSYGGCRVEDFAEIAILLAWLFGVGVMLFASTLLGLRKRVEDWQAQRSAVSVQKQVLGKSQ